MNISYLRYFRSIYYADRKFFSVRNAIFMYALCIRFISVGTKQQCRARKGNYSLYYRCYYYCVDGRSNTNIIEKRRESHDIRWVSVWFVFFFCSNRAAVGLRERFFSYKKPLTMRFVRPVQARGRNIIIYY